MGWVNNIIVAVKKHLIFEKDAEQVDIRAKSLPDWLYKITIKSPEEVKSKVLARKQLIVTLITEIGVVSDRIELHQILNQSLSKYKKETIQTHKEKFSQAIKSIISLSQAQTDSIDSFRKYFSSIQAQITLSKKIITSSAKRLEEYYEKDLRVILQKIKQLEKDLSSISNDFVSANDQKVEQILLKLNGIFESLHLENTYTKEVQKQDSEIEKLREHVYKLGKKIQGIRNSTRFKDVLHKESKLGELLEELDTLYSKISKKVVIIRQPLLEFGKKIKQEELVKEYNSHIEYAIEHDTQKTILSVLQTFKTEIGNKKTKIRKAISDEEAEKMIIVVDSLLHTLEEQIEEIAEIQRQIGLAKRAVRNHVILHELEDIEGRKSFYQEKLIKLTHIRQNKLEQINSLEIEEQKNKLKKELLILTGYDVNVIYDEK